MPLQHAEKAYFLVCCRQLINLLVAIYSTYSPLILTSLRVLTDWLLCFSVLVGVQLFSVQLWPLFRQVISACEIRLNVASVRQSLLVVCVCFETSYWIAVNEIWWSDIVRSRQAKQKAQPDQQQIVKLPVYKWTFENFYNKIVKKITKVLWKI